MAAQLDAMLKASVELYCSRIWAPRARQDSARGPSRATLAPELRPRAIHARLAARRHHRHRRAERIRRGWARPARTAVHAWADFHNLILADEINRTPPKTQAALLQAMQERCVTVGGTTHVLPDPFQVFATRNPIEQEGTYPLPEAQLDRFLLEVHVDYPSRDDEIEIARRTTRTRCRADAHRQLGRGTRVRPPGAADPHHG